MVFLHRVAADLNTIECLGALQEVELLTADDRLAGRWIFGGLQHVVRATRSAPLGEWDLIFGNSQLQLF